VCRIGSGVAFVYHIDSEVAFVYYIGSEDAFVYTLIVRLFLCII